MNDAMPLLPKWKSQRGGFNEDLTYEPKVVSDDEDDSCNDESQDKN